MTTDLKVAIGALVAALVFAAAVTAAGRTLRHASELSVGPVALGTQAVEDLSPTNAPAPAPSPAGLRSEKPRTDIRSAPKPPIPTSPPPPAAPSTSAPAPSPLLPVSGSTTVQGTVLPPVPVDRDVYYTRTDDYGDGDSGDQSERHDEEK